MTTGKIISMSINGIKTPIEGRGIDPVKEERRRTASKTTGELYWSAPVSACIICGCAHRSPYDACNSCRAGQLAAQQQITVERLKRAGRRMAEACSSAAAHAVAIGAMLQFSNLGPVYVMPPRPRSVIFDEIADMPKDFPGYLLYRFDQSRPPAEPRPKRDRRNRGPQQHGKWWRK